MADMLQFDPKFYNALDAYNRGSQDVNVLAQQRAEALLKQIESQRKNEMIDAEMAEKQANMMNARMKAEAYARQVAAQEASDRKAKPFDLARAEDLKRQASFAPLNALYEQMQTDIPSAAQSYNQLREAGILPKDVMAMEGPEATFVNPGQAPVRSRFNPGIMRGLLEGFGRPKTVADIQRTGMQQEGATTRTGMTNQTNLDIANLRADVARDIQSLRLTQHQGKPMTESQVMGYLLQRVASGQITPEELQALDIAQIVKAASVNTNPNVGITPTVDEKGKIVLQPGQTRRPSDIATTEPTPAPKLPSGWTMK